MTIDERTPILVGGGQVMQREADPARAQEPLALMVDAARRAAADAGAGVRLLQQLDTVAVVNILAWSYPNAPGLLAERLGARPSQLFYTTLGGNTPQWLVNETAAQIAAGRVRFALLAGAETVYTLQRARKTHTTLHWTSAAVDGVPDATVIGGKRHGTNDHEMAHGLTVPTAIYPLFENALRAHYGLTLEAHRRRLGELCQSFSKVAAQNPYAWFQHERSAEEIASVTPQNRLIGFPYPKYMNAIMDVDQSAAVLMTSVGAARELGIDPTRWVYLRGCADTQDLWFVSERCNYHSSPAIREAGARALRMAGVDIEHVDYLDLYSCFPCAVQIARDMLGIAVDDPRALTVTGGLPYHGGPGNNYVMHAIATMLPKLRGAPGTTALVTGLGWYVTKHSVGVYSSTPPSPPWVREEPVVYQAELDRLSHPDLVLTPGGRGVIETYTVLHDREGAPMRGIVIGRLDDGRRFLANTPGERDVLEELMAREAIGRTGTVSSRDGMNLFEI